MAIAAEPSMHWNQNFESFRKSPMKTGFKGVDYNGENRSVVASELGLYGEA